VAKSEVMWNRSDRWRAKPENFLGHKESVG